MLLAGTGGAGVGAGGGTDDMPGAGGEGPMEPDAGAPAGGVGGGMPLAGTGGAGAGEGGGAGDMPGAGGDGPDVTPVTDITQATEITRARLLVRAEYRGSVNVLFAGRIDASSLELPDDPLARFATVGASSVVLYSQSIERLEKASQTIAQQVFSDPQSWQAFVGCEPQADLSDACVETFVQSFGRKAFRRDLAADEAAQWVALARDAAVKSGDAAVGLATLVSGLLQSPSFLYRIEHAVPDLNLGRVKYDGASIAIRLAYALTGAPPSSELLAQGEAGALGTPEAIRAAATQLLETPAAKEFVADYFAELGGLSLIYSVARDTAVFPEFSEALRPSMMEEIRLWLANEVLAPGKDVRKELFTSNVTYVDSLLADLYGLDPVAPEDGFVRVELAPELDRAGILGKAGFIMAHSSPDSSNPTRRGNFILKSFTCTELKPPAGIKVEVPKVEENEEPRTTRWLYENKHMTDATCIGCHTVMDPYGFAMEHFDSIGKYREVETVRGTDLPIDDNVLSDTRGDSYEGIAGLGEVLATRPEGPKCMATNLYRYANGLEDVRADADQITKLTEALAASNFVWRDFLLDFVSSDAFTSLPPTAQE